MSCHVGHVVFVVSRSSRRSDRDRDRDRRDRDRDRDRGDRRVRYNMMTTAVYTYVSAYVDFYQPGLCGIAPVLFVVYAMRGLLCTQQTK